MKVKCVVACRDASGVPTLYPCVVRITKDGYDGGDHYDLAREEADDAGYEVGPGTLVYDEDDGPAFLFRHFFPEIN
jgi:hypothetical protein